MMMANISPERGYAVLASCRVASCALRSEPCLTKFILGVGLPACLPAYLY